MEENSFFQKALADFTQEAASGGAIRHLTDRGYTVRQIQEKLDFPVPYEKVQRAVWDRLVDRGVISQEEPGKAKPAEKAVYVREYDKYGKASFRRVPAESAGFPEYPKGPVSDWKESRISKEEGMDGERLAAVLHCKTEENGEAFSYMSCEFGVTAYKSPAEYEKQLCALESRQREYIGGLPWERRKVYHRLDARMREILIKLYRSRLYCGECYFLKTREKIVFPTAFFEP